MSVPIIIYQVHKATDPNIIKMKSGENVCKGEALLFMSLVTEINLTDSISFEI